jgi:hypothetical protein
MSDPNPNLACPATSHNKAKHDNLPLTEGHRLALVYDLRVSTRGNKPPTLNLHNLTEKIAEAEADLVHRIACWAEEIDTGTRANHPLLFVLDRTYILPELSLRVLAAEDRAKVLAVQKLQRGVYGKKGYQLQAYLAGVVATARTCDHGRIQGLKYTVDRAVGLEGEKRLDVAWGVRVDERCLVQPGMFDFTPGREREDPGTTTMVRR